MLGRDAAFLTTTVPLGFGFCQRRVPVAVAVMTHIAPSPPRHRVPTGREVALAAGLGRGLRVVLGGIAMIIKEWQKMAMCNALKLNVR
jgi:hypothetical protein